MPLVKIFTHGTILAAYIAKLGIRHAKGPSDMRLKYFRSVQFLQGAIRNIPTMHVHNNVIEYFQNCLNIFKIFENFPVYSNTSPCSL